MRGKNVDQRLGCLRPVPPDDTLARCQTHLPLSCRIEASMFDDDISKNLWISRGQIAVLTVPDQLRRSPGMRRQYRRSTGKRLEDRHPETLHQTREQPEVT